MLQHRLLMGTVMWSALLALPALAQDTAFATVGDTVTLSDAGTGAFFYVEKSDGQAPVNDILRATNAASRGKGGFFTVITTERGVPAARALKLTLKGEIAKAGPPIVSLFSMVRGSLLSVGGEVEVQLEPGRRYRVHGVLDNYRREVWLEEEGTGRLVGKRIAKLADSPEERKAMEGALYTCCNLHYEGDWISDANWTTLPMIPAGARIKLTDLGSKRAEALVDGRPFRIGLDYGRGQLTMQKLMDQLMVKDDPAAKIAAMEPAVQAAVKAGKVMVGMTRDEVVIALGPPRADETPAREAHSWNYYTYRAELFTVVFDAQGRVEKVEADKTSVLGQVQFKP